jgi:hypothetical protein
MRPTRRKTVSLPAAPAARDERPGRPLMIIREPGLSRRARVIGSLTDDAIRVLLEAVEEGLTDLDLSGVDQVDDHAVHVLAGLRPGRCVLRGCPRWLERWLNLARRP